MHIYAFNYWKVLKVDGWGGGLVEHTRGTRTGSCGTIPLYTRTLTAAPSVRTATGSVVQWSKRLLEMLHKSAGTQMRLVRQVPVRISDVCRACVPVMCNPGYNKRLLAKELIFCYIPMSNTNIRLAFCRGSPCNANSWVVFQRYASLHQRKRNNLGSGGCT